MRKGYATQGAVQPGPVFLEDAKGNRYDAAGNIIPPAQDPVSDALSVARRETDPYLMVPGHEHLTSVPPTTPPRPEYVPGETISTATQPSRDVFWQGVEQFRTPQTEPRTPERAWELLSGAGQIGLGALGTGISGAIGAGVEMLPTWLTGPQNQRNKLASELNEMTMFADPMLGPDALAATAPVQRVGGVRNAMAIEGDLAKQRMAERGPATFYDPLKVASGVDPTEAGKAIANAKDTAIAKVGDVVAPALKAAQEATGADQPALAAKTAGQQLVDDQMEAMQPPSMPANISPDAPTKAFVQFGKPIPPSAPLPDPALVQQAQADTRMGADIVKRRLPVIVPEQERVVGGVYTPGMPDGRRWSDLTPQELSVRGKGAGFTNDDLQNIWNKTLSEVSEAGRQAVANTGATWKTFPAEMWDKALKLPLRSQLWYELSGEAFVDRLPDLKYNEHMMFLDLVGATSARARPGENLERALAVLSQHLRGVPIDVDLTTPSTVSAALRRDGKNVSSDLANKTGMFSDTLALTGGLPTRYPISVNDVWVGKAFGITDDQLSANQALHEVFGKYTNKLRDLVNKTSPSPYPHQSWNLQSRQWVELRAADEGVDTSIGSTIEGSDYAGEWGKVLQKLQNAGIDVSNGEITRDILMDPRFADALRSTTPGFRSAPKATIEFGTLLTPNGQKAADIYNRARQFGDQKTQDEYLSTLTTSMYHTARGKKTIWDETVRSALGKNVDVTRIYSPKQEDPFAISGTFGGAAAPNIRVPLRGLTPDEVAYFNAVAGKGLRQKAMAAVEINRLEAGQPIPEGAVPSHAVQFEYDGPIPQKMLTDFAAALGEGFEVSAVRYPDSMVVDINPRFGDAGPEAADPQAIASAIKLLEDQYGIKNAKAHDISYKSEYGKNYVEDPGDGSGYRQIINATLKGWEAEAVAQLRNITGGKFSDAILKKYLKGDNEALKSAAAASGSGVSVFAGRANTVRESLRKRLSDHADVTKKWNAIGKEIDKELGALIPKWERRYTKAEKKSIKEAPQRAIEQGYTTEAYRGSNRDIQEYGPRASESGYYGGKPTYFTSSPEDATGYTRIPLEEYEVSPYDQLKVLQETNPEATLQDVLGGKYPGLAEEYVNRLAGGENLGAVYPSKLKMQNPVRVGGEGETVFKGEEATNLVKTTANTLAEAGVSPEAALPILSKLDDMLQSGGFGAMDFDLAVREAAKGADKRLLAKIGSILADVYQKAGFDSIDLDTSVFSSRRAGSYSYPAPEGSRHYMVFDPENIRGRFAKFGGYGPEGPAYMKAMGGAIDDEDIDNALRLARAMGGRIGYAEAGSVPVMLEDAKGNKYDAQGNIIPPTSPGPNPARSDVTPQSVAAQAVNDPATYDAIMEQYAIPDRDIAEYEALKAAVSQQPQDIQQMTHVGDRPRREMTINMPLFGGEYSMGTAPYDVAQGLQGAAQTAYDFKTMPAYFFPATAPFALGADVLESRLADDPLGFVLNAALTPQGASAARSVGRSALDLVRSNPKATAAAVGAGAYLSPDEAEAGPERWFSKAMEVARALPMEKMTGQQALAMLRKGVSPEELRWTGADVFLPQQKQITKQDLVDYLAKNRVQTKDVVFGGPSELDFTSEMAKRLDELTEKRVTSGLTDEEMAEKNDLYRKFEEYQGGIKPLRYGPGSIYGEKYVTPGGTDYRETLITLPEDLPSKERKLAELDAEATRLERAGDPRWRDVSRERGELLRSQGRNIYSSGHWEGVPNVMAHVRTQVLDVTPPGANRPYKAFNVDEAQSDLAQAGRKQGFSDPEINQRIQQIAKERVALNDQYTKLKSSIADEYEAGVSGIERAYDMQDAALFKRLEKREITQREYEALLGELMDSHREAVRPYREKMKGREINEVTPISNKLDELARNLQQLNAEKTKPPLMPYVGNTQGWTDLSIKKALDQAMDAGADYFTYTPGEAQAKRYGLSNVADTIRYNPPFISGTGKSYPGRLIASKNGSQVFAQEGINPDKLPEYIGKELAETLLKNKQVQEEGPLKGLERYTVSGDELKIGGRGMVDYYDNIYKKRVEKVVKDATGKKVQWEVIPVQTADGPREQLGFRLTDDMKEARFSDFNKGGRVADPVVNKALALTRY